MTTNEKFKMSLALSRNLHDIAAAVNTFSDCRNCFPDIITYITNIGCKIAEDPEWVIAYSADYTEYLGYGDNGTLKVYPNNIW